MISCISFCGATALETGTKTNPGSVGVRGSWQFSASEPLTSNSLAKEIEKVNLKP